MRQSKQQLEACLPLGELTSRRVLLAQGVSSHGIDNHLKSGVLQKVVTGIYMRHESRLIWQGIVASLPRMMGEPVAGGGLTALELQGFAQYLGLGGKRRVHLYSPAPCPSWLPDAFRQMEGAELKWHRTTRLWQRGWPGSACINSYPWQEGSNLPVSAPEQAMLELLLLLPDELSFEHAEQLMQGLTQLSPRKLDGLLRDCMSVKVKRLFFWLADRFDYPWRGRLKVDDYDLGSGKRVVAKGGKLDQHYAITVPQAMFRDYVGG